MKALHQPEDNRNPVLDNVEDIYPLTPLQEGMVFHAIAEPDTAMHVGRIVCHLQGTLHVGAFHEAWNKLLARHAALRTAFIWDGLEAPMQVVRKSLTMPFQHHDWTALSTDSAEEKFDEWLWQDAVISLDLANAPLCQVNVFSFSPDDHRLVWACHHAIADGWSIGVALEDLLTYASGAEHTLLPKAPRYRDHIAWLLKRNAAKDEQFWRDYLKGFNTRTSIEPTRLPSSPATSERRHYTSEAISSSDLTTINAAATSSRVTLNSLFQAAWALVLSRYTSSDDVVFGVVSSGRPDDVAGVERMVGLLVTTTPMRVQIRDRDTVRSLLKRLHSNAATIRHHEQAALTKLQSWGDLPPGEALFDCLYVFGNYPPQTPSPGAALRVRSVDIKAPSTFPLAILVDPDGEGGLVVTAVTDPSHFSDVSAQRIVDAVVTTAHAIADNLDAPVTTIDSLPKAERRTIDAWGHGGELDLPCDDIVKTIEAVANSRPNAIAAVGDSEQLTYGELLDLAHAGANALQQMGVGPGEPIVVHIDKGPGAIVGILAVLMAGAAYVPVDPTYPLARRTLVIEDCQARFIVTIGRGALEFDNMTVVDLNDIASVPPPAWTAVIPPPETPAYIIYTSGSSGRPKGVVVSRSNLAYSNTARRAFFGNSPKAFLLLSSLAFDSSVVGLFWTLSTGGKLVVGPHRLEQDVERFAQIIAAEGVTHLLCLPTLYAVLIEHADPHDLASLSHAIVAGEACPPALPARHRETLPTTRLINEYGPTEATVWCVVSDITETPADTTPPIGRPIPGTTVMLADHRNRPVPIDAVGELMIGGPGIACGYHRQPEMTATSFLTRADDEDVRFYRTGDFARWRADGTLDYLGRRDGQHKIRGHRIEIAEIEAALEEAPTVDAAAATVVMRARKGARLAAFVESLGVAADCVDTNAIRRALELRLPDAMVPLTITALPSLPRLPNGKIDRSQLIPLAETEIDDQNRQRYVAPTSEAEQSLVAIWEKVLKIERVGIRDDFFALGGDSLASIRIVSLARRQGLDVKPTNVLEFPTIETLARSMISSSEERKTDVSPSSRLFFMVHGGERLRDCLQDALQTRFAVHLFDDHWNDGNLSPLTSIQGIADDYLAELRVVLPHGPYLLGGYSIGAAIAVVMAQRLMAAGEEVELLFLLDPPDMLEFLGGVQGLDQDRLKALSSRSSETKHPASRSLAKKHGLPSWLATASSFVTKTYTRYMRGPFRLVHGSLAYALGLRLPPKAAGHYAWIVYSLAIKRHTLSPYAGRLLIFRSMLDRDDDQAYLWQELAMGEYAEDCFVCEHIAFRRDPEIVKAWTLRLAEKLRQLR